MLNIFHKIIKEHHCF